MGFTMEDSSSCFLLYKAALAFALIRWALSWAFKLRSRRGQSPPPPSSSSKVSPHMIRRNLVLTTYGEIMDRHGDCEGEGDSTCAVCLSQLGESDEVRELRNCNHVFHRECIDQWVDHDDLDLDHDCFDDEDDENNSNNNNHRSCPLCRAPLLTVSQGLGLDRCAEPDAEPSWAVERILYLFGDDLLC